MFPSLPSRSIPRLLRSGWSKERSQGHAQKNKQTKTFLTETRTREKGFCSSSHGEQRLQCTNSLSDSLRPHGLHSPRNSPGQNTGVGSLSLLQGIFPTQVSRIAGGFFPSWATREVQEYWSGLPFPNRTGVSCIAGGFFTNWAIREARNSRWDKCNRLCK